jgi:DNA-binding CsgD family transcriptional regulator
MSKSISATAVPVKPLLSPGWLFNLAQSHGAPAFADMRLASSDAQAPDIPSGVAREPDIRALMLKLVQGATPSSPMASGRLVPSPKTPEQTVLSPREHETLKLLSKGLSLEAIGCTLEVSRHTVVAHLRKIYRKLGVHSRGEAVFEALQLGLI